MTRCTVAVLLTYIITVSPQLLLAHPTKNPYKMKVTETNSYKLIDGIAHQQRLNTW